MSKRHFNSTPAQPIFFMPPQPQLPPSNDAFSGFGGFLCSILAGLILGQLGIRFPGLPKW